MTMEGLKTMAIRASEWREVFILHSRLGKLAFPSLKHLAVVFDGVEAEIEHFPANGADLKSSSFSMVTHYPIFKSTRDFGRLFFEFPQTAEEESDRVDYHGENIRTATLTVNDAPCSWTFFLAQESHLLARATERMLEHTERAIKSVDDAYERLLQLH
jgi:hypothetical protein